MFRRPRIPVLSWGLGLVTLVVLLLHVPATRDLGDSSSPKVYIAQRTRRHRLPVGDVAEL